MTVKTDVSFRISGPCLSLLLYDGECNVSDQVGFLIGEQCSVTTQTISDAEMEEEKTETQISINGTIPVGLPLVFFSSLGRVDESSLKKILDSCEKDVVGWYSFRRNSNHSASLRETLLHRELCKVLRHIPSKYFVFCIITAATNERCARYTYKYTFSTERNRKFYPVSVSQTNLGEPEDNVYRRNTVADSYKCLQRVLQSIRSESNAKDTMRALHSEINQQVKALQSRVIRLQAETAQKTPTSSCTVPVVEQQSSSRPKPDELSAEY